MITVRVRLLRDDPRRLARARAKWHAFQRRRLREQLIATTFEPCLTWAALARRQDDAN